MRNAQNELQSVESQRTSAATQAQDASAQLEALREELYEVPLQSLVAAQAPEITELQVEAYLERCVPYLSRVSFWVKIKMASFDCGVGCLGILLMAH